MRSSLLVAPLAVMLALAAPRPADAFMNHSRGGTAFGMHHSGNRGAFRVHRFRNVSPRIFTDRGFFFVFNGRTFFSKFPPRSNGVSTPFASSFGSFGAPFTGSSLPFGTVDGFADGIGGFEDPAIVALSPSAVAALSDPRFGAGFTVEKTQGVTVIRGPGSHHVPH